MELIPFSGTNLKEDICTGVLTPNDVLDAVVWANKNQLEIQIKGVEEKNINIDELYIFFWDYSQKRALFCRRAEIHGATITWKYDKSLKNQMEYAGSSSARMAYAIKSGTNYSCGYFRNKAIRKPEVPAEYRMIGKLEHGRENVMIAYWTDGGALSVKKRSEKSFDADYTKVSLVGMKWDKQVLVGYLEVPFVCGIPQVYVQSTKTKEIFEKLTVSVQEDSKTDIRRILRVEIDLGLFEEMPNDSFQLICFLDDQQFKVCSEESVVENEMHTIQTGEEQFDAMTMCLSDGLFIIQCTRKFYPVLLSIVSAVYNTAPFLEEMINSILQQKVASVEKYIQSKPEYIGCKDVFELILVDDGSTDGSADILDDYARLSDKIRVIHKENGGVSSARNLGIEASRGKYINFTDSDDILQDNFISENLLFIESHPEIIMTTAPLKFFDAATGDHWTNYKFNNNNRVIDLMDEPDAITVSTCSSVFRNEEKLYFDTRYVNGEDIDYIYGMHYNQNTKIGAIGKTAYMYRRRSVGEGSAIQQSGKNPAAYTEYLRTLAEKLLVNSRDEEGIIPKYMQYNIMGQLQWKFSVPDKGELAKSVLGEEGFREYKNAAYDLLKYIDDDVILNQKKIWNEHKYFLLMKKYGCSPELRPEGNDACFYFGDSKITTPLGKCYVRLDFMNIKDNVFHLEGHGMQYEEDFELIIYINGEKVEYKPFEHGVDKYSMDEICFWAKTFVLDYPLNSDTDEYVVSLYSKVGDIEIQKREFRYAKTMPLAQAYTKSYFAEDGWAVRREGNDFVIRKVTSVEHQIDYEGEFVKQVNASPVAKQVQEILELRRRAKSLLLMKSPKTKIWLLSDRINVAGDNGEAMFRYINSVQDPTIDAYFVIDKDCDDYEKMQQVGKVLVRGSKEHLLMHLIADFVVSSSGEDIIFNPWSGNRNCEEVVRDLLALNKFIFLQHGITKDDISGWLNRYNKNITGFVCAAPREAQSILDYNYYYKPENVWLTGFPRHDRLYHNEKNYLVVMPTWRKSLSIATGSENKLIDNFENSEYCVFYNNLINNERLLSAAEEMGYKLCFMPHPSVKRGGIQFFHKDPRVEFLGFDVMYKDVYAEASLCITDYSSAVMDFALLRKPVVYCHFDKEQFFASHMYTEGYYDYEQDGFGEVTYDMESLIDVVISYMKDNCRVHEPYGERIDKFFGFNDTDNCKRVCERIKQLY